MRASVRELRNKEEEGLMMFRECVLLQRFFLGIFVWGLIGGVGGLSEAYEAVPVQNGGVITGKVKFVGSAPPPAQLEISRDQQVCGTGTRPSESLIVSSAGGIKNVVVSLANINKGKAQPPSKQNPTLVQEKCWFSPHILLIPAGSTIDVLNNDKVMHNIHTAGTVNPILNKAHPSFRKKLNFTLEKPETIRVKCDIHGWMEAWFIVTAHPYYVVTDEQGAFTLTDVPPGTYSLEIWHETLGTQTKQVTVNAKGETKVDIEWKR
jgi:plastocyanin